MAKEKKTKTPTQLKKKYNRISRACVLGEFVSAMTPFVVIGIVNYDKYFVEYDGTKMSIALFMALAVMGMAIYLITKKKLENSYATLLIGWTIVAFIFTMLGQMITDLATIMWFGLIGLVGAYGFEIGSKEAKKKANKVKDAMESAKQDELKEAYKEELKEKEAKKLVKIKVVDKKESESDK